MPSCSRREVVIPGEIGVYHVTGATGEAKASVGRFRSGWLTAAIEWGWDDASWCAMRAEGRRRVSRDVQGKVVCSPTAMSHPGSVDGAHDSPASGGARRVVSACDGRAHETPERALVDRLQDGTGSSDAASVTPEPLCWWS